MSRLFFEGYLKQFGCNRIVTAVNESLNANIRTPDIQTKGQPCYETKEVEKWIIDYIG